MSSIYTSGNDQYFYSDKIKVFPCAYRGLANPTEDDKDIIINPTARLNTEYNFTHLPHMVDKASYIIEFDNDKLICVIQGYYFEIELGTNDSGISDYSILYNKNKYLNICVASPSSSNGENFIEGPHLCSWESSNIEDTLDIKQGSDTFFAGLKISSGEALSKDTYQCYALKLDTSAMLPIMANKIENSAGTGKPISQEFTTETLSATTSTNTQSLNVASDKLIVNSSSITANVPVTINNTLEVKTGNTSVLKAESTKVTINKPTTITGATDLKGTVGITGKATIGNSSAKTEIENNKITTSEITANKINIEKASNTGSLVIDKTEKNNHIIEIKDKSDNTVFSVNTDSGETYAKKINAQVEGTSTNAVNAQNVTDTINGTNITAIFGSTSNKIDRLKLRIIEPDTDATWVPGADQSVKIILKKDTDPVKTKAVSFFLAKGDTAAVVKADEFIGVAETAQAFDFPATIRLYGDVDGEAESKYGWNIQAEIGPGKVTNDKLAGSITNDKLENSSITIGGSSVSLGSSTGTSNNKIAGTLYGTSLNLSGDVLVSNIGNIKVNNAGLKSSSLVRIDTNKVYLGSTNYGAIIDSTSANATFVINSAKASGDMLQINKFLNNGASSTKVFNIDYNGNVTANTYNAASDRRLKENIIDYKPEKSILDLPIKKFDFIEGPKNQIGCIAQDLKEICPEIVNENEKGYLSIQENKLVYLLLDEVKKLKNEVEELKNM